MKSPLPSMQTNRHNANPTVTGGGGGSGGGGGGWFPGAGLVPGGGGVQGVYGTMKEPLDIVIFDLSDSPAARTLATDLQQRGATVTVHNKRKASPDRCVYKAIVGTTELARVGPSPWLAGWGCEATGRGRGDRAEQRRLGAQKIWGQGQ